MVGADGFEPPKVLPADLQSAPFGHSGTPPINCQKTAKNGLARFLESQIYVLLLEIQIFD